MKTPPLFKSGQGRNIGPDVDILAWLIWIAVGLLAWLLILQLW